jgi:Ca-activated chloride channel family protein
VLLVTDSVDSRAAAKARELWDEGISTSVLAVGTPDGAPIPSGNGFINDRRGNVVISRLDRGSLQDLSNVGGGRYTELSSIGGEAGLWKDEEGQEFNLRDDAMGDRWKDMGPWLVLLLLPLAVLGFRQGLLFSLVMVFAPLALFSPPVQADWWDDLWSRKDQQAWNALQNDDAPAAAALARDPELAGEAWYRASEYGNALDSWMRASTDEQLRDDASLSYNRGNALAHAGELDAALKAYDEALALEPDMEDARHNREIVEQMKQQQEQQEQQDGESQDGESSDEQQQSEDSEQSQEEGEQDENSEEQEGEDESQAEGENAQQQEEQIDYQEAWSEEDAQAMEQWLNRIPDDPGGLLRRKFRNEHQRRGSPDDESEVW